MSLFTAINAVRRGWQAVMAKVFSSVHQQVPVALSAVVGRFPVTDSQTICCQSPLVVVS